MNKIMKKIKSMRDDRKGQMGVFDSLMDLMIAVGAVAIVLIVVFVMLAQGKSQIVSIQGINVSDSSTYTAAYNASTDLQGNVQSIVPWIPLVIIASIGTIILGLVLFFRTRGRR